VVKSLSRKNHRPPPAHAPHTSRPFSHNFLSRPALPVPVPRQAEELELSGLVESLTRKNRHLTRELGEAHRANEEAYAWLVKSQAAQVGGTGLWGSLCFPRPCSPHRTGS
jgi:hypothetical protein